MRHSMRGTARTAVELLIQQGETTRNAKLIDMAGAVLKRHAEKIDDAAQLGEQIAALHERFVKPMGGLVPSRALRRAASRCARRRPSRCGAAVMARVTILAPAQPLVAHAPARRLPPRPPRPTDPDLAGLALDGPAVQLAAVAQAARPGRRERWPGVLFTVVFAGVVVAGTGPARCWPGRAWSRAVLGFLLLASGALAYFIGSYGIVFDPAWW